MNDEHWISIISRVTPDQPMDLDDDIFKFSPLAHKSATTHMLGGKRGKLSEYLWQQENPNRAFLGVRIHQYPEDLAQLAITLASLAIEKQLSPIILTTSDNTGLQQYGFRVERLAGETPQEIARSEQEIAAFWGLVAIVDPAQLAAFT